MVPIQKNYTHLLTLLQIVQSHLNKNSPQHWKCLKKKTAKKQKNPNIIFQHAMFWWFFLKKKNIPKPNIKLVKPTIFWKNASPTSSATGNLLSVTVKRMASIIPSKSLVARVRTNQMVIACLGATGAMVETRAVLCFWLDYYNKITSHMPSYMFFLSNMMLQQHFGMVFWGWYQNDDLFLLMTLW